ncbi:STM4014 family protein [Motilimonas sp. 1_MG-2023]|uniref:STM4014 family protein n=1 Tax=Motilimonas sp. 1_MG-2023 TaxID=3062672 RepID=UPI0026E203B1|nr:STM4014 family protein [Motilimonas sp. 1_MG-2023]MDO6525592.1 STM4014 family protein [Motilimonas sp. 1_MG-2023]
MSTAKPLWILICNPENRRQHLFQQALPNDADYLLLSYLELLQTPHLPLFLSQRLRSFLGRPWLVKIDSAGENFAVEKALLQRINPNQFAQLANDKGRFHHVDKWFLGFKSLLTEVAHAIEQIADDVNSRLQYLNSPRAILAMADKWECQQYLRQHQVPTPLLFEPINNLPELVQQMRQRRCYQVFVKSRYGSSASGVMALRLNPKTGDLIAKTSLERVVDGVHSHFYNSLKVKTYREPEQIAELLQQIVLQQAYVEAWVPKPQINGRQFDLRILLLNGKAGHYVTRTSLTPMTNLHLGNQRGDILAHHDGERMLQQAFAVAEQAASIFPEAGCIGADVICGKSKARVVEINGFGDLLPRVSYQGLSSYQAQVKAMQCY